MSVRRRGRRIGSSHGGVSMTPTMLVATTTPETAWAHLRGQLKFLRESGFDVVLMTSPEPVLDAVVQREGCRVRPVVMSRSITPLRDIRSVFAAVGVYRSERPEVSIVGTPKAGLVAGIAALLTRTRLRLYLLRGLRLETETGLTRALLWSMERVAILCAHEVIAVSPSLLDRACELRLLPAGRGVVLGDGASNGVDLSRFDAPGLDSAAADLRFELGIPADAFLLGFVGRLTGDKGIAELVAAFTRLSRESDSVWLMIVGNDEVSDDMAGMKEQLTATGRVRFTGWLPEPQVALTALDVLVLPTYREGFPVVALEAAAARRAVVTTTATGAVDSVDPGVTGLLVPPRDASALHDAIESLVADPARAEAMGRAGRARVEERFTNQRVWQALYDHVSERLAAGKPGRRSKSRRIEADQTPRTPGTDS